MEGQADAQKFIPPSLNGHSAEHQTGNAREDKFLALMGQMILENGIGYNVPVVVQAVDPDTNMIQNIQTTPAQLLFNLTQAIQDNTLVVDEMMDDEDDCEEEEPPPRKKKRR